MANKKKVEDVNIEAFKDQIIPIPAVGEVINGTKFEANKIYEITVEEGNVVNLDEAQAVSEKEETVLIYVGPTNNNIARYTSYINGYPAHLNEHLEKCKVLKSLFVEPDNFAAFEQNVIQKGTIENISFGEAKKYFSKAVK